MPELSHRTRIVLRYAVVAAAAIMVLVTLSGWVNGQPHMPVNLHVLLDVAILGAAIWAWPPSGYWPRRRPCQIAGYGVDYRQAIDGEDDDVDQEIRDPDHPLHAVRGLTLPVPTLPAMGWVPASRAQGTVYGSPSLTDTVVQPRQPSDGQRGGEPRARTAVLDPASSLPPGAMDEEPEPEQEPVAKSVSDAIDAITEAEQHGHETGRIKGRLEGFRDALNAQLEDSPNPPPAPLDEDGTDHEK